MVIISEQLFFTNLKMNFLAPLTHCATEPKQIAFDVPPAIHSYK